MIFKLNLNFGLSLFYEYFSIFEKFPEIEFHVSFTKESVICLRPEHYYDVLYKILISELQQFKNVVFFENEDLPKLLPETVLTICSQMTGRSEKTFFFSPKVLESIENYNYSDYIILNTKILIEGDDFWTQTKDILSKKLEEKNIRVMLIGEKQQMDCLEYKIHSTKSLYTDIKDSFDCIDLSVDSTEDLYSPEIMRRNLYLLKKSKFNIHYGEGGGRTVFYAVNHTIMLCTRCFWANDWFNSRFNFLNCNDRSNMVESFTSSLDNLLSL
jgi:hypothetical protein